MLHYAYELTNQANAARLAADDLNRALASAGNPGSTARAFAAVQSLLGAAAMMSKLLWCSSPSRKVNGSPLSREDQRVRDFALDRARSLRLALEIKSLPVLESRAVRNSFEHFDERLDRYLASGETNVADLNIGPLDSMIVVNGKPLRHLRGIETVKGTVSVLGQEVGLQELFDATQLVGQTAAKWIEDQRSGGLAKLRSILEEHQQGLHAGAPLPECMLCAAPSLEELHST